MPEPVSEPDLQAFIDGQLAMPDRIEIERRLQAEPEAAAAAIAGLRLRDELRLFLADPGSPAPAATVGHARALSRKLSGRRTRRRWRRAMAAAVLLGIGWFAHAELNLLGDQAAAAHAVPAHAHEAARSVATLAAEVAPNGAPVRLTPPPAPRTGGDVPLPELPLDGRLVHTASVSWQGGTALAALYRTTSGKLVSLFAGEAPAFDVVWPRGTTIDGRPTVFWQTGPYVYALSGALPATELLAIARAAVPRPWALFDRSPPTEDAPHG